MKKILILAAGLATLAAVAKNKEDSAVVYGNDTLLSEIKQISATADPAYKVEVATAAGRMSSIELKQFHRFYKQQRSLPFSAWEKQSLAVILKYKLNFLLREEIVEKLTNQLNTKASTSVRAKVLSLIKEYSVNELSALYYYFMFHTTAAPSAIPADTLAQLRSIRAKYNFATVLPNII